MSCPICEGDEAVLAAVIREHGETRLMLRCENCPAIYPLSSEALCPCLEAFAEVVTAEFPNLDIEALRVHRKCITGDFEFCVHYREGTCPREKALCAALSGGVILLPHDRARVLLTAMAG